MVGSLSTVKIVEAQAGYTGLIPQLACSYPLGIGWIRTFHDRRHRRIQSFALRSAGR